MQNELIKKYKSRMKYYVVLAIIMLVISLTWLFYNDMFKALCFFAGTIIALILFIINLLKFKTESNSKE